jgi:hypothetical protein
VLLWLNSCLPWTSRAAPSATARPGAGGLRTDTRADCRCQCRRRSPVLRASPLKQELRTLSQLTPFAPPMPSEPSDTVSGANPGHRRRSRKLCPITRGDSVHVSTDRNTIAYSLLIFTRNRLRHYKQCVSSDTEHPQFWTLKELTSPARGVPNRASADGLDLRRQHFVVIGNTMRSIKR